MLTMEDIFLGFREQQRQKVFEICFDFLDDALEDEK